MWRRNVADYALRANPPYVPSGRLTEHCNNGNNGVNGFT
jgi:hypothetical protein